MQKPAPALLFIPLFIPYIATVKIHIWIVTIHSSAIILFYFDRLYKPFFLPFPFIFPNFFSLLHFFPFSSLCSPSISGCGSGFVGLPIWVGCGGGVVWLSHDCGCGVADLGWMWWWSRGCGCGVANLSMGVVVCDLVSAWWWSRGCGCGVAGGLRREARNEEREKKFK